MFRFKKRGEKNANLRNESILRYKPRDPLVPSHKRFQGYLRRLAKLSFRQRNLCAHVWSVMTGRHVWTLGITLERLNKYSRFGGKTDAPRIALFPNLSLPLAGCVDVAFVGVLAGTTAVSL